jgi:hypothetical protein
VPEEDAPFIVRVERDPVRQGRFRWIIYKHGTMRDASIYSFATKREAQADGDKFAQKLIATWRTD